MKENVEKLVDVIKKQAKMFLLEAGEFYPFGSYINNKNEVVPVGASSGDDHPPSLELIDLLEKALKEHIQKGDCKLAAIAIDVAIKEHGRSFDAIEMRFLEANKVVNKKYYKYELKQHSVEFFDN